MIVLALLSAGISEQTRQRSLDQAKPKVSATTT
jgi:hypothetical protein